MTCNITPSTNPSPESLAEQIWGECERAGAAKERSYRVALAAAGAGAAQKPPVIQYFRDTWENKMLWKNPFCTSIITGSPRPVDAGKSTGGEADDMSTSSGRLSTVGGVCLPLTLQNEDTMDKVAEEYKIDEKYDDEYTRDESMEEVEQMPNLSSIMDSIQTLTLTVASLQITPGRQKMGGAQTAREAPTNPTSGRRSHRRFNTPPKASKRPTSHQPGAMISAPRHYGVCWGGRSNVPEFRWLPIAVLLARRQGRFFPKVLP